MVARLLDLKEGHSKNLLLNPYIRYAFVIMGKASSKDRGVGIISGREMRGGKGGRVIRFKGKFVPLPGRRKKFFENVWWRGSIIS